MARRFAPFATLTVFITLAVAAAGGDEDRRIDADRYLGSPVQVDNLTVWPVHTRAPAEAPEISSLHDAQEKGLVRIREKGAGGRHGDSASVNELVIENSSDRPILVTAGTILKGGKQDRQLGQDLLVAAGATVPVDAFCVERGRWSARREGQSTEGVFEVPKMKAAKRLRAAAHYEKNQSEVWEQVDRLNRSNGKAPPTSTFLATVDEDDAGALESRKRLETGVLGHFAGLDDGDPVVGFAYSVDGEPLGMRVFASREILDSQLEPFVKTMSLEAQVAAFRDRQAGREAFDRRASSEALLTMVRAIGRAPSEERETAGLNKNRYQSNEWGGHSSCLIERGGSWVPLTEDWTAPARLSEPVRRELERLEALGYTD